MIKKNNAEKECEIFNIKEQGKTKTIKKCAEEPVKPSSKKEIKKYEKTLKIVFFVFFIALISTVLIIFFPEKQEQTEFQWQGIDFQKINAQGLTFYNTTLHSIENGKTTKYIIYLRKDPRKTYENIEFQGEINLKTLIAINFADSFYCDGDATIAFANFVYVHNALGARLNPDENATCNSQEKYTYIEIKKGNQTKIIQTREDCYEIIIKDCEILAGTERFMLESLKKIKQIEN